jgi:hypothetical protein
MSRLIVLLLSALLVANDTFCQVEKKYSDLVVEAQKLYLDKDYQKAALKYSALFSSYPDLIQPNDKINAACSWSMVPEPDSAFKQLISLSKNETFQYFSTLNLHPDLKNLQADKRWDEVINRIKQNRRKTAPGLNYSIVEILDTVYYNDQRFRWEINEIEKKYGWGSDEMKTLIKNTLIYDSLNQVIITDILDKYGWLGTDDIGIEGNATLFLVIQHANIKTQVKYLPMMRDAVKKGNARAASLALLEDRVALRQGGKQIYGSQISRDDKTGKYYVMPLEDPDNVDKRRQQVGLGPIKDYVSEWGIIWDVKEYMKFLQQLEDK